MKARIPEEFRCAACKAVIFQVQTRLEPFSQISISDFRPKKHHPSGGVAAYGCVQRDYSIAASSVLKLLFAEDGLNLKDPAKLEKPARA